MKQTTWHWPDHVIGKRESRRLREEHNALADSHADLVASLGWAMRFIKDPNRILDSRNVGIAMAALDAAKEVGHE